MTSKAPVWETSETGFVVQEYAMTDFMEEVIISWSIARGRQIINSLSISEDNAVDFTNKDNFFNALNDKVNVARVGVLKGRHGVTS